MSSFSQVVQKFLKHLSRSFLLKPFIGQSSEAEIICEKICCLKNTHETLYKIQLWNFCYILLYKKLSLDSKRIKQTISFIYWSTFESFLGLQTFGCFLTEKQLNKKIKT